MATTITPVIDDKTFAGSDKGLALPLRRTSAGSFALRISNLDHADPPPPYQAGGVPRSAGFNRNVFALTDDPKMPIIPVACDAVGFDPAATKIAWRLQTLYVVGRYKKISGGSSPHYRSRVLSVGDVWTGESSGANFQLFDSDAKVSYDNRTDRVAGGNAILTVAAKPGDVWLQDYVHLRILGTNPTEAVVRNYVHQALADRNKNIEPMADAVFAWEAGMKQFDGAVRTSEKYKGVPFKWPQDPANFPVVAFDFGIGLGQFTHIGQETVGICWDWRDNLDAGMNELLDDLRATFAAEQTFLAWAKKAWTKYNGSPSYGIRLAGSPDSRNIATSAPPGGFDRNAQTAHVAGRPPAPPPRAWPVTDQPAPAPVTAPQLHDAVETLVNNVGAKVSDPDMLAWMWPKIEDEVVGHGGHDDAPGFPGLHASGLTESLAHLDRTARRQATDAAFAHLWARVQAKPARRGARKAVAHDAVGTALASLESVSASGPGNSAAEFNSLNPAVRKGLEHGISDWATVRLRMFTKFGAAGNPAAAIPRINAYYGQLVPADFPPTPSSTSNRDTPVHPILKARLDRAAALLQGKNLASALKVGDVGGFSIRNNVNTPSELSNHSFGWAVDLDPELNPNIARQRLPLDVIAALSGLDLYGATNQALRTPRQFDACLPDVTLVTQSSAALVDAFRTLANLKASAGRAIARIAGITLTTDQIDTAFTAARQGQGPLRQALAAAGLPTQQGSAIAKWLLAAVNLFAVKQQVRNPEVLGNAGTVARFGFCNLQPALIAALIATDGGSLNWLGAAVKTKDFMHFDLRPADQAQLF